MNRMESASYARGASGRAPRVAAAGTGGRLTRAPGTIALPASVYWTGAPTLAVVLLYVIAVRLHELLPVLHYLRPALLSAAVALVLVMTRSTGAPLENAFRDTSYRIALAYVAWAGVTVDQSTGMVFAATGSALSRTSFAITEISSGSGCCTGSFTWSR